MGRYLDIARRREEGRIVQPAMDHSRGGVFDIDTAAPPHLDAPAIETLFAAPECEKSEKSPSDRAIPRVATSQPAPMSPASNCERSEKSEIRSPGKVASRMDAAHRHYERAVATVARFFDAQVASGINPPRLEDEGALDEAIAERFRAGDADGAMLGIEKWKAAWLDILSDQQGDRPALVLHPAVEAAARRLETHTLIELANDAQIPAEDQEAYRREVHRRAQGLLDECDGRRPHPNRSVHDMFDRLAGGQCRRHRHWRSTSGVVVCGECHPPAHPALVAEWLGEGGAVTK